MKKITLKDIAKIAGVSVGTVQRALNNFGRINKDTKERIVKIANELNYEPSYIGKTLATGNSYYIGFICPVIGSTVYDSFLSVIETKAQEAGYVVCVGQSQMSTSIQETYLNLMQKRNVDGLILVPQPNIENSIDEIINISKNTPLVILDSNINCPELNILGTDDYSNVYKMTDFLIKHGRKRISYMYWDYIVNTKNDRLKGYLDCIKNNGLEDMSYILSGSDCKFSLEILDAYMKNNKPEVIMGLFDAYTLMIVSCLSKLGYKIPDDVEIVGYDNIPGCEYTVPSLTTIAHPVYNLSTKAVDILLDLINGKNSVPINKKLKGTIILRDTVKSDLYDWTEENIVKGQDFEYLIGKM